jgi:thiol-disulfide isomerase/thioredoxin
MSTPGMSGPSGESYGGSETLGRISVENRGAAAPDLAFSNAQGRAIRLSDFEGRPLLVNLWATWCAPCIREMPTLDALAEREEGQLKVLTISQDFQGADVVGPYFIENSFNHLEPWLDEQNAMMMALASDTLPVTVLYDADGMELFRVYGGMDWSGERAETLISGALGG